MAVLFFQSRFPDREGLWEKQAAFFGVAGLGAGFFACRLVYKLADTFVNRRIFVNQIVVILIIRIKMFQLALKQWNLQIQLVVPSRKTGPVLETAYRNRKMKRAFSDSLKSKRIKLPR